MASTRHSTLDPTTAQADKRPSSPMAHQPQPGSTPVHPIHRLQQAAGNQFVHTYLARRASNTSAPTPGPATQTALNRSSGGRPLPASTRSHMEGALGTDLSRVRTHTDPTAAAAARELNAQAFTSGQHIHFGANQYQPQTAQGQKVLAHELAHTVQQRNAPEPSIQPRLTVSQPNDPLEREAEAVATRVVAGQPAPPISRPSTGTTAGHLQRKAAAPAKAAPEKETAPGVIDLKTKDSFPVSGAFNTYFKSGKRRKGTINVRFGALTAEHPIKLERESKRQSTSVYTTIKKRQAIPLQPHPLFASIGELPLVPSLIVKSVKLTLSEKEGSTTGKIESDGFMGVKDGDKLSGMDKALTKYPELIGLSGFALTDLSTPNKIENGVLSVGPTTFSLNVGNAISGKVTVHVTDQKVESFAGNINLQAEGLGDGQVNLKHADYGQVTGEGSANLTLPKNFQGSLKLAWDGQSISGEGKVGYQGEKLSGTVTLRLMERSQAEQLAQSKTAPPEGAAEAAAPAAKGKKKKSKKKEEVEYVVFGEGDLNFAFNEWLNGTAQVITDHEGHVTIIGEITPQKEFELFEQKDFNQHLFEIEGRARYGLPVVGNIFIFANVSMDAFAKLGPAKFYNIVVQGTYSTDPQQAQAFSIQGSLNISAAAGLRLRGEAGAGLEIISHDLKAGAGVNALAGIQGYAEATPIIGYREKAAQDGEDKKGEFFIRGDLEIAAQPFLGLSGDLFVEVDAPWWSPLSDKKWTWPLGGKEWPLGNSFGIGASVDYVFGSGQWPSLEFKPVDFSADKFFTDLYSDEAKAKSGAAKPKPGQWKEKNQKAAKPPEAKAPSGGATPGAAPAQPAAQPKVKPGGSKKATKPANPNAKTADGRTVKQLQEEAARQGKKPGQKAGKTEQAKKPGQKAGKTEQAKKPGQKAGKTEQAKTSERDREATLSQSQKWDRGAQVVKQALAFAERTGISEPELNRILKSIRRQKQYGFKKLYAREKGTPQGRATSGNGNTKTGTWMVFGSMSPEQKIVEIPKKEASEVDLTQGPDISKLPRKHWGDCTDCVSKLVRSNPDRFERRGGLSKGHVHVWVVDRGTTGPETIIDQVMWNAPFKPGAKPSGMRQGQITFTPQQHRSLIDSLEPAETSTPTKEGEATEPQAEMPWGNSKWDIASEKVKDDLKNAAGSRGIGKEALDRILGTAKTKLGFKKLYAKADGNKWIVFGSMSDDREITRVDADEAGNEQDYKPLFSSQRTKFKSILAEINHLLESGPALSGSTSIADRQVEIRRELNEEYRDNDELVELLALIEATVAAVRAFLSVASPGATDSRSLANRVLSACCGIASQAVAVQLAERLVGRGIQTVMVYRYSLDGIIPSTEEDEFDDHDFAITVLTPREQQNIALLVDTTYAQFFSSTAQKEQGREVGETVSDEIEEHSRPIVRDLLRDGVIILNSGTFRKYLLSLGVPSELISSRLYGSTIAGENALSRTDSTSGIQADTMDEDKESLDRSIEGAIRRSANKIKSASGIPDIGTVNGLIAQLNRFLGERKNERKGQ